jgi:hypothetical protein
MFVSRKKLQRCICTISGQLTEIALEDLYLGLDRIGSHTEENSIGNIRSICQGDNRTDNVEHQVARFKLARSKLAGMEVERKIAKRVNLGAISLGRSDAVEIALDGTPASFAAELLKFSKTKGWAIAGLGPDSYPPCGHIDPIWRVPELAPRGTRFSRVQRSAHGCYILSRDHLFQGDSGQQEPPAPPLSQFGPWSAEEREKLR